MSSVHNKILSCTCCSTIGCNTDQLKNLAQALDLPNDSIDATNALCRADEKIFETHSADTPSAAALWIGCTQEKEFFSNRWAEQGKKGTPNFFNIREQAGWSAEAGQALPKMAALTALALKKSKRRTNQSILTMESEGVTLLLGDDERVIDAAEQLKNSLNITVLLTGKKETSAQYSHAFPIARGTVRALEGYLGNFQLVIDHFSLADASSRDFFRFSESRNGAVSACDIVIDMRKNVPLVTAPHKRDGYIFLDPDDPIGVQKGLLKAASLTGIFEKPAYIEVKAEKCAHSRSFKNGCSRCLDVCPTGALSPVGEHVQIDPFICAGCGSCSAVCPTGAMEWVTPSPAQLVAEIRQLIKTYYRAGGEKAPVLLLHDETHGTPLIEAMARFGKGLPANVLPYSHPYVPALEVLFAPLVYGAGGVIVLTGKSSLLDRQPLNDTVDLARTLLKGLAYNPQIFSLLDSDDPLEVEQVLYELKPASSLMMDDFLPTGNGRSIAQYCIDKLFRASVFKEETTKRIALPAQAAFGHIHVTDGCTLCLSCVSACPVSALHDGGDERPALKFLEQNCIQCGLCRSTCPEQVISLEVGIAHPEETHKLITLKEEEPAYCMSCGVAFGTRSSIEQVVQKLSGQHSLYQDKAMLDRIYMCADCRIKDHFRHI